MRLTAKLKQWAVQNLGLEATATEKDFKTSLSSAIAEGELTPVKFAELSSTKEDEEADEFSSLLKGMADTLERLAETETETKEKDDKEKDAMCPECGEKMTKNDKGQYSCKCGYTAESKDKKPDGTKGGKKTSPTWLEKAFTSGFGSSEVSDGEEERTFNVRVKEAIDVYDGTKTARIFPKHTAAGRPHTWAGRPVMSFSEKGRNIDELSDRDKAVAGAYAMFEVNRAKNRSKTLAFMQLPEHAKEILCWALENEKWGGASDGGDYADIKDRKLTPTEQKALIDDATSGGLEAAPIVFDDDVIQTPLLHGELFPLVNVVPLDRGRRVEGVVTGTVTGSWGGVDDTAISLFTTTSYVSAFDTTIFRWEGAIRIGLDFLSDTPIDFGQHVTTQYGERLLEDLDDVIADGDGSTQPEGVMQKSGATSVTFSGATSIGNYESLRFGVAKPEHRATVAATAVFAGTETSYQRARAIPVGGSDARRLGGMDYSSYSWMERPYKINESLSNQEIFYAIMARYRMYRRRGLTMRTSTEGDTLIRNNELLMVAMARYGGQMERGSTIARTTDAPA